MLVEREETLPSGYSHIRRQFLHARGRLATCPTISPMPREEPTLAERLEGKRVCICAGAGGVGKTSISAALALGLAARGQRVAVLSIDPAKRLAQALSMSELGDQPRLLDAEKFAAHGLPLGGELWAMMLDSKRTFDALISTLAPDEKTRDEILSNRIYREISSAVAGSQEFSAITKLYELDRDREFDVIVLDTPPSRDAIAFLDAPGHLTRFLEGRALAMFLTPSGMAARFLGRGGGLLFSALGRVSGVDLLSDLSVFFGSLSGLIDGFRERSRGTEALLRDPACTFLIITSPEREPAREAIFLRQTLADMSLPFGGLIVNRVNEGADDAVVSPELAALLSDELGERLAHRVAENLADFQGLARRDRGSIERLREAFDESQPIVVPLLEGDIADIDGLVAITRELFGEALAVA
jgi:anion-transporting  ArsA/GET3 family ATPase